MRTAVVNLFLIHEVSLGSEIHGTMDAAVGHDVSVTSFIYLRVTFSIGLFAYIIVTCRFLFNNIDVEVNNFPGIDIHDRW